MNRLRPYLLIVSTSLIVSNASAQWQPNGVPVTGAGNGGCCPTIVSDGAGGVIVAWYGQATGCIYAQRLDEAGFPQWIEDGVLVSSLANHPVSVSDDASGVIVTWYAFRGASTDIYAQRINEAGIPQWTSNGVALCSAALTQEMAVIASDGMGGAIVAWQDQRNGAAFDIYAQRVDTSGVPQWGTDGIAVCTAAAAQYQPAIASDGAGGAIIAWRDERSEIGQWSIRAQRVDPAGICQWVTDGVTLTDMSGANHPSVVSDDAGGAIVIWHGSRDGPGNIFVQRIDASGAPQWMTDGVAVSTAPGTRTQGSITSDDAGGVIVAWAENRDGASTDLYAQRLNSAGSALWPVDGVALCAAKGEQGGGMIVSDSFGGAILTWGDYRSGMHYDVYAQRVDESGVVQWYPGGASVCALGNNQYHSAAISDLAGGAFVTWVDFRGGLASDIYVQRMADPPTAASDPRASLLTLAQNYPNPFNPATTIRLVLSAREHVAMAIYDANGRLVRTLVDEIREEGAHEVMWDGRDDNGAAVGSGVYFCRLRAGSLEESKKMVLLK